jgi:hypothetical protein
VNFFPAWPILTALFAALAVPVVLALLSHGPWKIVAPGRRFLVAVSLAAGAWPGCLLFSEPRPADLLAGVLILASAVLAEFTLWTLIAWGFTASLLMTLARENRSLATDEWIAAYTAGQTIDAFSLDRLGVLFRFGLAVRQPDRIVLTRGGRPAARFVRILRLVLGLSPC